MLREEERPKLHFKIGRLLRAMHQVRCETPLIFLAVDQLNRGRALLETDEERLEIVSLNIDAGLQARKLSATLPASEFLHNSTKLLLERDWKENYSLALQCYNISAEFEEKIDSILRHAVCLDDTIRANTVRVHSFIVLQRFDSAIKASVELLNDLEEHNFPLNPGKLKIITELLKTKRLIARKSDDDLLKIPQLQDARVILACQILSAISMSAVLSKKPLILALSFFKLIQLSVAHGVCDDTPFAFAGYAFIMNNSGKPGDAKRFGRLAIQVGQKLESQAFMPRTFAMLYTYVTHESILLHQCLGPLLQGFRVGLESGDSVFGSVCIGVYPYAYAMCGLPLGPFVRDMKSFCDQLHSCHQNSALGLANNWYQFALNMTFHEGHVEFVEATLYPKLGEGKNVGSSSDIGYYLVRMFYYYVMNDLDKAEIAYGAINARWGPKVFRKSFVDYTLALLCSLLCLSLYRKTKKRKYLRMEKIHRKYLKASSVNGSVNSHVFLLLVEAEEVATSRRKDKVRTKKAFENAISILAKTGFVNLGAIACERAAECMSRFDDEFWSGIYMKRTISLYREWGGGS